LESDLSSKKVSLTNAIQQSHKSKQMTLQTQNFLSELMKVRMLLSNLTHFIASGKGACKEGGGVGQIRKFYSKTASSRKATVSLFFVL